MKRNTAVLLMTGALSFAAGFAVQAETAVAQDAPDGNAEVGRETYVEYGCPACHGYEGQGAGNTGPRLAPDPIAFRALSVYVRQPSGNMPPYTAEVVTDQELADIYAFLESIPPPPSVDSILPIQ